MSNDNKIKFRNVGNRNTINIHQEQNSKQTYVEYLANGDPVEVISQTTAKRRTVMAYSPAIITVLSIFADVIGISDYFGIQSSLVWLLAFIGFIVFSIEYFFKNKYLELPNLEFRSGEELLRNGHWVRRSERGDYVVYSKTARCIYPKCKGRVHIISADPQEYPNHTHVGVCSIGGRQHTYTVDPNGIGYPILSGWRTNDDEM